MSEKEKETIEDCKELVQELKQYKDKDFIGRLYYRNKPIEDILSVLLNLIEKQQKEIEHWKAGMKIVERDKNNHIERLEKELDNLKEIEKSHKEENGLLRQELDMQIEHNKELEATLKQTQDSWFEDTQKLEQEKERNELFVLSGNSINLERHIKNNYISKDKIKEKLAELENKSGGNSYHVQAMINAEKNILKELLEEK